MIGKGGGLDRAELYDSWKEVVEDWGEWWWGNGLSIGAVCNFFAFECIHLDELLDTSASGDWIIINSVCCVG